MDPFTGHWVANLEKSRRHANHQFASASMTFEVGVDTVSFSYEGINAAGKHESSGMVLHPDGTARPLSPEAPSVAIRSEWVGSHRIEMRATAGGKVVGAGSYEVSADGQVLTATLSGIDASGSAFEQVIVFDRR